MSTSKLIALDGFATKEISLVQKPINEVLKESEGVIISFTKATVKKNLNALVKKHEKEINELIALEVLTVKQENRLIELRKHYKDSRIALDKITKHNSSVLAQASKSSKVVKDELTLIVEPIEIKISNRLEAEETRREKAREEKETAERERKEKIEGYILNRKKDLQKIIDKTKTYQSIEINKIEYFKLIEQTREFIKTDFDLEEFEVDFDTMLTTQAEAFQSVITSLTNAYNLEQSNKALEVAKLTNERMTELFDYDFKYKGEIALGELDLEDYVEIMVPERTNFRIKELENLGFTKNEIEECYIYNPNENITLLSHSIEDMKKLTNNIWQKSLEYDKEKIENYKEPTTVNEIEIIENEPEVTFIFDEVNPVSKEAVSQITTENKIELDSNDKKTESIEEPIKFDVLNECSSDLEQRQLTPLNILLKWIWQQRDVDGIEIGRTVEFVKESLLTKERENIIQTYNDCQKNILNHFDKESIIYQELKNAIDSLDALEYFNQKFA